MVNEFISAAAQLAIFTLVPFIFFLFRKNKTIKFPAYIGLTKPTQESIIYSIFTVVLFLIAAIGVIYLDEGVKNMVFAPISVTGKFRAMGFSGETIIVLLLIAWIKTSLAEEILFRGFVAKRLIHGMGFSVGNWLQAFVFGAIHFLLFWKLVHATVFPLVFIFVFSTLGGWVIGFIKEKYANGSIIPGWIAHGLANTISYSVIAFIL